MTNYQSLEDALAALRQKGYNADFTTETEIHCLYSGEFDMRLEPEEFHVDESYWFDGPNGYESQTRLYAISSPVCGLKGTLIDMEGKVACTLSFIEQATISARQI